MSLSLFTPHVYHMFTTPIRARPTRTTSSCRALYLGPSPISLDERWTLLLIFITFSQFLTGDFALCPTIADVIPLELRWMSTVSRFAPVSLFPTFYTPSHTQSLRNGPFLTIWHLLHSLHFHLVIALQGNFQRSARF